MKVLTLSIKQQYFDEILAGKKKNELRVVKPQNTKKYVCCEYEGKTYTVDEISSIPDDVAVDLVPIKYDAIKLLTGAYTGKRPWLLVEVKNAELFYLVDDNENPVMFEYKGEEQQGMEIEYTLGEVIERSDY